MHILLHTLLKENRWLKKILRKSKSSEKFIINLKNQIDDDISANHLVNKFVKSLDFTRNDFEHLNWQDFALIRIHDYLKNSGREFIDQNKRGAKIKNDPFTLIWKEYYNRTGIINEAFYIDMLELFRQLSGSNKQPTVSRKKVLGWMEKIPTGIDQNIIEIRKSNRDRILRIIIEQIDKEEIISSRFSFEPGMSDDAKFNLALEWWEDFRFHLKFAVRTPELLNRMLDNSLSKAVMDILYKAREKSIPVFVNPYYLSLLLIKEKKGIDQAIRDYILYSQELVDEFGHIVGWEKEDIVESGKPNGAGWIIPSTHNIHRRYPDVAIMIPGTMGRACGGLCASCQRMYDFQRGNLNFDMDKLKPAKSWKKELKELMDYFENDSQLRDILITGGDAFMSSEESLKQILNAVYKMAKSKRKTNFTRKNGEKYAEISRIRFGTRLPVYLPQKITDNLISILKEFKEKAAKIGIKQFVVQTHFQSPLELTPEAKNAVNRLLNAGWLVTNQLVFTTGASRRGHTAKLRKILNDFGVLTYYTFTVKGYKENYHNFATNARAVQEQLEEKIIGLIPDKFHKILNKIPSNPANHKTIIDEIRDETGNPFLATDKNVLNLPAVGKSLSFRTIGITEDGRRILKFFHDNTRRHSPIIENMRRIFIIESKSISEYLKQMQLEMDEDIQDYKGIFGYSMGVTESRMPVFEYPEFPFETTDELTNFSND